MKAFGPGGHLGEPGAEEIAKPRTSASFSGMKPGTTLDLERDCEAVQIPAGNKVVLPAGTAVDVVQDLGGSLTIRALGSLFRIDGRHAGALGRELARETAPAGATGSPAVDEKLIWDTLKTCYDPEIPVNIVDLGLVYDLALDQLPEGDWRVAVKMTLTAPGCGMGPVIARDAQERILALPGLRDASVEIVWDPPWHQSMITAEGRKALGLE